MKSKMLQVLSYIQKYKKLSAFVFGGLSVLAFAPRFWILFAFVGYSVFIRLLTITSEKKNLFKIGYIFGFTHFALGFSWVGNALLIDVIKFGWLYPITLFALGAFFGLFFAFPAVMTSWGKTKWQKWLIFSSSFVLFEWVRSFIFTVFQQ